MLIVRKIFIVRRKWDAYLLWFGAAAMPIRHGVTPLAALVFAVIGAYLIAFRQRSRKTAARCFLAFAIAYFVWVTALVVARGEPWLNNRQFGYSIMIALLAFSASGMVLIRQPMRYFVAGARVGSLIAAAVAMGGEWLDDGRFGMGGNPAPFALLAALTAVAAAIPIDQPSRWLPNSYIYPLAGTIAVFASETRAVLIILPIIFVIELAVNLRNRSRKTQFLAACTAIVASVAIFSFGPVKDATDRLFIPVIKHYTGDSSAWNSATADVRFAMWKGAIEAIGQRPLIGYGEAKIEFISKLHESTDVDITEYTHLHNMFLDEIAHNGFIGLFFLCSIIISGLKFTNDRLLDNKHRRMNLYMLMILTSYGMFHNPLQHESTIVGIFLFICTGVASASRVRSRRLL